MLLEQIELKCCASTYHHKASICIYSISLNNVAKHAKNVAQHCYFIFVFHSTEKIKKKLNKERNKKLCCNMLLEQIELIRARTYQHRLF